MNLVEIKPLLTLRPQFKIPSPHGAWCHKCDSGFPTLEKLMDHMRKVHPR
jgi:thiol-disulfide isomerase/thioredoxin